MAKFFRNRLDIVFGAVALALFIALTWYVLLEARFLAGAWQAATDPNLIKEGEIATFNLVKAREILKRKP